MRKDKKKLTSSRDFIFIAERNWSAELFLMRLTFFASFLLIFLAVWELGTIIAGFPSLYIPSKG
jgi:hypothetical protein